MGNIPQRYLDCNLSVGRQHVSPILEELTATGVFQTTKFTIDGNHGIPSEEIFELKSRN